IIYGAFPETRQNMATVTQLLVDGDNRDWAGYPQSLLQSSLPEAINALRNQDSLYIVFPSDMAPSNQQNLRVNFTLNGTTYALTLDPRLEEQTATWRRVQPNEADLGTVAVAATQSEFVELRIPLRTVRTVVGATIDTATLDEIQFVTIEGDEQVSYNVAQDVPPLDEVDGVVYLQNALEGNLSRFTVSGTLAQSAQTWSARGRVQSLTLHSGENLRLQLDVTMNVPDLAPSLVGLNMMGQIWLQPVADREGRPVSGGLDSNNGWSAVLTPSGLAIDNLRSDFLLGETTVPSPQVLRRDGQLVFGLNFDLPLPEDLPDGLYVPVFRGMGRISDGEIFVWEENGVLGQGSGELRPAFTRLPVVLNVGGLETPRLLWSLFQDNPNNGSRGLLAGQDASSATLSNRVRYNSPTYILPPFANGEPIAYPLEPYLINQMGNDYQHSTAPLLPFLFPGGRLSAQVTRPDGTVEDLGSTPIVQNRLSTAEDDRLAFGARSQVDVYRLTTLNPLYTAFIFDEYGPYTISLTGNVEDVWGNRYEGGGNYSVLIAELLDLTPAMLPGTPFEVGDSFNAGLNIAPGVAAEVTISARIYPLDGGTVITHTINGTADRFGYFHDGSSSFVFDTPGEYVIDYEVRFTDSDGRLWAGSLRSAGVIASPDATLIAHGERGLDNYNAEYDPAWFNTRLYTPEDSAPRMRFPYHSGDVLWYGDGFQIQPVLTVQDTEGSYQNWLLQSLPGYTRDDVMLPELATRAELPVIMTGNSAYPLGFMPQTVVNNAYNYVSVVRPGLSIRQFVTGREDGGLLFDWSADEPDNQQIGAGPIGESPGDYVFLFGGAVIRNAEAGVRAAVPYGALGVVIDQDADTLRSRVYPPFNGEAGGPDGGPLMVVDGEPVWMFFHPTSPRPGQVFSVGDTLAISGHVAPTLPASVQLTITNPNGETRAFEGQANAVGYFYDPAADVNLNTPGLWTVGVTVRFDGVTSAGQVYPPLPEGGLVGTLDDQFSIYVLPENAALLDWNERSNEVLFSPGLPYNFNFMLPNDWTESQVHYTVTIPSYILEDGTQPVSGQSFSYQYNPINLNRRFAMLETDARTRGAAASDPVTLSFMATGLDSNGRLQMRSRTFTIFHDRLLTVQ
ncbi:MAG: hypothetical protein K8L99_29525, partial [Anaerolineae bacterium]|nr:hypothetical protein [Anaerolineae bacterium]